MNDPSQRLIRYILTIIGLLLFAGIFINLWWLATASGQTVSVLLAFAAGFSMIFLPCTLPLVFVIVPLTLNQRPARGFLMALLFGLGISITLSVYGAIVSQLGGYFGLDKFTRVLFVFAGVIAILFGWSELKFIQFSLPKITSTLPYWIIKRGDYAKALGMGMLLGNAGVGCPNPAFYVILTYIASLGSLEIGAGLGFVHGLGRAAPLLAVVILAILGVNMTKWIAARKDSINKIMGWSLVTVGAFILTYGLWGMYWWENSIFHANWNRFVFNIAPALAETPGHTITAGVFNGPISIGWWTWIIVILISIIWYWLKQKRIVFAGVFFAIILLLLGYLSLTDAIETKHSHGISQNNTQSKSFRSNP